MVAQRIRWQAFVLVVVLITGAAVGLAQEAEPAAEPFVVEMSGLKTWTLSIGFGDAIGLAAGNLAPGHLRLDQTLAVDLEGVALGVLTIEAHFDDRLPEQMQSLAVRLDTDRLDGVFGDFHASGFETFTALGRKMKGLRLDYTMGDAVVTAIAARLEGISETKTFVGGAASDETVFARHAPETPAVSLPYKRNLAGLYAYPIDTYYVPEFTDIEIAFAASSELDAVLASYGIAYLADTIEAEEPVALEPWEHVVIGDVQGEQVLLLTVEARRLVRDRLKAAIARFNEEHELVGDQAKIYPFAQGTAYELAFLDKVAESVRILVDGETIELRDAVRSRFYDLGRENVKEGSADVSVSADGVAFESIDRPGYDDYHATLYPAAGIIEFDFPAEFFTDDAAVEVAFDYVVTGGVFSLGLSLIPGSDRVTVNGEPLARDIDYQIDYEVGMLFLLVDIGETDVVQIEYELYSGGLGRAADYASYFYGLMLDWPVSDALTLQGSVVRIAEDAGSAQDRGSVGTMPNLHTIAGITGSVRLEDFAADFLFGYSVDRFPFDDNARASKPNEILAIAVSDDRTLFGHRAGLTVWESGAWRTLGLAHGLSGRVVRSIAMATDEDEADRVFLGTNSGLTMVTLDGTSPFDRIGNWRRFFESDGLPGESIGALLIAGDTLWIGTDEGLARIDVDAIDRLGLGTDEDAGFDPVPLGETDAAARVTALAAADDTIYVGTGEGVFTVSADGGGATRIAGTEGQVVHDLLAIDGTLYVASSKGLRGYRDGIGVGWLVIGQEVLSIAMHDGRLVFGTDDGLRDVDSATISHPGWAITALAGGADVLWIGSRADGANELKIWRRADFETAYDRTVTAISGVDPFGFLDVDPEDHTAVGTVANASFRRTAPSYTLSGRVSTTEPSYRPLGSFHRGDSLEWALAGSFDLSEGASLSVSHELELDGRTTRAVETRMENSLTFSGIVFGPSVVLSAQQESVDDAATDATESNVIAYHLTVNDSLLSDGVDVRLSWSDSYATIASADTTRSNRLSVDVSVLALEPLTIDVGWSRPITVRAGAWSGSEGATAHSTWSHDASFADIVVDYDLDWSRGLPDGVGEASHELVIDVNVASWELAAWTVTPGLDLTADREDGGTELDAKLSVRGLTDAWTLQSSLSGELRGIGEPVLHQGAKLSASVTYTGIEDLRSTLTAIADGQTAVYGASRKTTTGLSLSGQLTWTPDDGQYDSLRFSYRASGADEARRVLASIENTYTLDLSDRVIEWLNRAEAEPEAESEMPAESTEPAADAEQDPADAEPASDEAAEGGVFSAGFPSVLLRADAKADGQSIGGDMTLNASITGRADVAFSPTWSVSLSGSYLTGTVAAGGLYHSVLFEVTFAITF